MTPRRDYRLIPLILLALLLAVPLSAQDPEINTVLNAASGDQRPDAPPIAPGSWVSIFGNRFASQLPATATTALSIDTSLDIPLETSLGGANGMSEVSVEFDGIAAPMLALIRTAGFDQINAQIPWNVNIADGEIQMTVKRDGQSMSTEDFEVADASPGIFTVLNGPGPAVVTNVAFAGGPADVVNGSYAHSPGTVCQALGNPAGCSIPEQAAPVGGVVTIWCNGLGPVDVPVESGNVPNQVGPNGFAAAVKPVKAFIGGVEAQVLGAALSSNNVALNQVSVFVPNVPPGNVPVQLEMEVKVGNTMRIVRTRPDVTMSVRAAPAAAALMVP